LTDSKVSSGANDFSQKLALKIERLQWRRSQTCTEAQAELQEFRLTARYRSRLPVARRQQCGASVNQRGARRHALGI